MKLPHQKSTIFLREVFPKKKHHKHTGRLNHHLKPLRGDGENRSGITSSGSLILKMWSKHNHEILCSFYPQAPKFQQKTYRKKTQIQAFGIQLFTFQWRIACSFNHQVLSHKGANPIQTLPLVPSTIVTGPKALIALHFIPHSCKRNGSLSTTVFFWWLKMLQRFFGSHLDFFW